MNRALLTSRKVQLISLLLGLVVAVGGYAWLSIAEWMQISSTVMASERGFLDDSRKLLDTDTPTKERAEMIEDLSKISPLIACSPGWWANWQAAVVAPAKKTQENCEIERKQRAAVQKSAKKTRQFLQDRDKLQQILAKLALGKANVTEGDFVKHAKTVEAVEKELNELVVHTESRVLMEKARTEVKGISKAWTALQKAHKAKHKEQYNISINALDQAYTELNTLSEEAIATYSTLLISLGADLKR